MEPPLQWNSIDIYMEPRFTLKYPFIPAGLRINKIIYLGIPGMVYRARNKTIL